MTLMEKKQHVGWILFSVGALGSIGGFVLSCVFNEQVSQQPCWLKILSGTCSLLLPIASFLGAIIAHNAQNKMNDQHHKELLSQFETMKTSVSAFLDIARSSINTVTKEQTSVLYDLIIYGLYQSYQHNTPFDYRIIYEKEPRLLKLSINLIFAAHKVSQLKGYIGDNNLLFVTEFKKANLPVITDGRKLLSKYRGMNAMNEVKMGMLKINESCGLSTEYINRYN